MCSSGVILCAFKARKDMNNCVNRLNLIFFLYLQKITFMHKKAVNRLNLIFFHIFRQFTVKKWN